MGCQQRSTAEAQHAPLLSSLKRSVLRQQEQEHQLHRCNFCLAKHAATTSCRSPHTVL